MANWVSDLDSMVYTYLKQKLQTKFLSKYPELRITNSSRVPTTPKFPTVYFEKLGNSEIGSTFDVGTNGINYEVQISTTTLKEDESRIIMDEIVSIMQQKYFRVPVNSIKSDTDNTFGRVSRFQRVFGANDTF